MNNSLFLSVLLFFDICIIAAFLYFMVESIKEKERRAPRVGFGGAMLGVLAGLLIIFLPSARIPMTIVFGSVAVAGLLCLTPSRPNPRVLQGASGWIEGEAERHDERDIVFARNRSIPPGSAWYRRYYEMHPELEEIDAKRRKLGGPIGVPGRIDGSYRPNVSMIGANFSIPDYFGLRAEMKPAQDAPPADLDPEKAALIVKNFAGRLGADLVGICRVNPLWAYSRRGEILYNNWEEDWGRPITDIPPYAVVIATEMDVSSVGAGPHTPCAIESSVNYAKGAYITTILANWFSMMGYKGYAEHSRHYNMLMAPLAIDAGLGECGRQGYLLTPKFGARVRVFAVLTDMPLKTDKPISIGADEFCRACKKCAEACPSKSIPLGEKTVHKGVLKWKLNAETCFEYWGKVGTDCSICMGICPFSRPNTFLHNVVRWFVANTYAGKYIFPHIDNFLYGKKWRPKPVPEWLAYPKGKDAPREEYGLDAKSNFA